MGNRGEKLTGVRGRGITEDALGRAGFHELAAAHDGNTGGELRHDGQTVRDEYVGEVKLLLQFLEQEQDLCADRNIEGRYRLVGDDQLRAQDEGPGDADALALAAGKFVRVAWQRGVVKADATENFAGAFAALGPGELRFVDSQGLGHDFANTHAGIERGERVLKDHLHLAALGAQSLAGQGQHIVTFEENFPFVGFDQAKEDPRERCLSAAAFADDGECFTWGNLKAHVVHSGKALDLGLIGE
jgi:hypothetical protein